MSSTLEGGSMGLLTAGRARLDLEVRDARDRIVASDPGLARLRSAVGAIVAMATTIGVEAVYVAIVGVPSATGLLAMLLGAVIAMPLSTSVRERSRRATAITVASGAVAAALGAAVGVTTAQIHPLGLAMFTVVSFVAVYLRRFGPRWFTLGFLGWQAFFFSLFLDPPIAALPFMVSAIVLATAWVGLLLLTVLHEDPVASFTRIVTALRARGRAAISAAIDVVGDPGDAGKVRDMRGQLTQLFEVSLLLDGQLSSDAHLPNGLTPGFTRRWVVDVEIAMDEICSAAVDLARCHDTVPESVLLDVRTVLGALGWADTVTALELARELQRHGHEGIPSARRLGAASVLLLETIDQWDHPALRPDSGDEVLDGGEDGRVEEIAREGADEGGARPHAVGFEPVVTLTSGRLPGSAGLAAQTVQRDDAAWWSPSRWRLTTRQAVQAGVAAGLSILIGEAISPQRYYWAVIASFIAFTGTATSGETIRKSVSRIGGTLAGLIVAVALANLTAGSTALTMATLFACIFGAFYLQQVSYAWMTFFITLMLGELYTLLHTFSDQLLVVRLEETMVGALVGVGVSVLVLPSGTRATLRVARQAFLTSLADLVDACAEHLDGRPPERDLITLVVQSSADARQVVLIARAMTRGRVFGAGREGVRHRVSVLGSADAIARNLAARVEATPLGLSPELAHACREIAEESRRLAGLPTLITDAPRPAAESLGRRVGDLLDDLPSDPTLDRVRVVVRRLADALTLLVNRRPRAEATPQVAKS